MASGGMARSGALDTLVRALGRGVCVGSVYVKNLANASAALAIKLRIERHIDAAPLDPVAIHPTLRQPVLEGGGEERSQAPLTTRLSRVGQVCGELNPVEATAWGPFVGADVESQEGRRLALPLLLPEVGDEIEVNRSASGLLAWVIDSPVSDLQ